MIKMMILLRRRPDVDPSEFVRWWLNEHRPLAERLPGLRRHCLNVLPDGGPFDAVVEQWFDSEAAADSAYAGPLGREVAADSMARVCERIRVRAQEYDFPVLSELDSLSSMPKAK
jgi:uncharacterized protein (TIGR02118 family)